MAKIQYTTPAGVSAEVEFVAERMSIGRAADNHLVIADESVSSHHGEIALEGGTWVLTDLGSTNGTKIGGERVERLELVPGGAFTLGHVECIFLDDEAAPPAVAPRQVAGYAALPIDKSRRRDFGPPVKSKGAGTGPILLLGVLALLICAYAAFSFTQLGS
jgi:hypothetical protein